MELRSSGEEGIHRAGFDTNNQSDCCQLPNIEGLIGSSSKQSAAASTATTRVMTDRRRNDHHGATVLLNPPQTLDPHLLHDPHSNNLPVVEVYDQQTNSNPNPNPNPDPDPAHPPPAAASNATPSVQYRECLKNHAASAGGHVVDGCGEFMPTGEDNTPEALRCAACDCHRNFHRRELQGEENTTIATTTPPHPIHSSGNNHINHSDYPYNINIPNRNTTSTTSHRITTSTHRMHQHRNNSTSRYTAHGSIPAPVMMAFHGGAPAESSSEDLNMLRNYNYNSNNNVGGGTTTTTTTTATATKKRHRTKFREGQKERMQEFAERLGWKMQKQDDEEVDQFCEEVGVKRQVFKVWMHNNKAAIKKQKPH